MIDPQPAPASVAIDVPLPAKSVEKPLAPVASALVRDYVFAWLNHQAASGQDAADRMLDDSKGVLPSVEPGRISQSLCSRSIGVVEKTLGPNAAFAARAAGDAALQQALHDDWRGEDWFYGHDLEKAEKWRKVIL